MSDPADLSRAQQLLQLGRPAEAERLARAALGADPTSVDAIELLAQALSHQNREEEGAEVARRGLGLHPDSADLLLVLVDCLVDQVGMESSGRMRRRRGDTEIIGEARQVAERLVRTHPNWWVSHYAQARSLLAGNRPRILDALHCANRAISVAPHSADAHNLAGLCLDGLNQRDAARAAYQEALRLDPHHAMAMNNLATLDVGIFRLREAARGFGTAASLEPDEALPRQNLRMLTVRLAMRILIVAAVGAVALAITLAAGAPWWSRAFIGGALVGGTGWFVQVSRGYLPRGMALSWRTLVGALGWLERIWIGITVVALGGLVAMSFAPRELAIDAGLTMLVIGRALLIGAIAVGLLNAFRGLRRR